MPANNITPLNQSKATHQNLADLSLINISLNDEETSCRYEYYQITPAKKEQQLSILTQVNKTNSAETIPPTTIAETNKSIRSKVLIGVALGTLESTAETFLFHGQMLSNLLQAKQQNITFSPFKVALERSPQFTQLSTSSQQQILSGTQSTCRSIKTFLTLPSEFSKINLLRNTYLNMMKGAFTTLIGLNLQFVYTEIMLQSLKEPLQQKTNLSPLATNLLIMYLIHPTGMLLQAPTESLKTMMGTLANTPRTQLISMIENTTTDITPKARLSIAQYPQNHILKAGPLFSTRQAFDYVVSVHGYRGLFVGLGADFFRSAILATLIGLSISSAEDPSTSAIQRFIQNSIAGYAGGAISGIPDMIRSKQQGRLFIPNKPISPKQAIQYILKEDNKEAVDRLKEAPLSKKLSILSENTILKSIHYRGIRIGYFAAAISIVHQPIASFLNQYIK